jgi:hypothetical protein
MGNQGSLPSVDDCYGGPMSTKTPCPYRAALSDSSWVYCRKEAGHADEHKPYESENDPYRCGLIWIDASTFKSGTTRIVQCASIMDTDGRDWSHNFANIPSTPKDVDISGDWAIDCAKEIMSFSYDPHQDVMQCAEMIRKHVAKFIHGYTMIGPSPIGPMHGAWWNDVIGRILKDLEK